MDAEAHSIQISCVSLVKPTKPTLRHVLYMSGVDQLLRSAPPIRSILFYNTHMPAPDAAAILQRGLASALVAFYPLAGQLVLDDDDGRLAIDCNDSGVELIEASCNVPFSHLQLHGFPIQPLFRRLVAMDHHSSSDHIGEPIASVQVTSFVGGLTLGFAIAHSVADGYAFWMFVRAVAEACKGQSPSMFPLHARTLLKSETFLLNKFPTSPARRSAPDKPVQSSYKKSFTDELKGLSPKQRILSIPPEELQQKIIHISKDMLQTLKMACLHDTQNRPPSSFDALSAYLWKRLTMAQELPDENRVDFRVPLDVRSRITPPLTSAFFGNAVTAVTATTTAKQLKEECLGATAARIRHEIQNGDNGYIKNAIVEREKMNLNTDFNQGEEVIFTIRNGSHFPVYQAAAFGWGEVEVVRPAWGMWEQQMTWYPSKELGGIDVITSFGASTARLFFSPHLYPNDPLHPHHDILLQPISGA